MIRQALVLCALLLTLVVAALFLGDQKLPPADVFGALVAPSKASLVTEMIVLDLRLPRALMAVVVGATLAVAGAISQSVMRNPLAEPGLLGINSGAALAALIVLVHRPQTSVVWLPWAAFGGALAMSGTIYALSWRGGASSARLILIGIGLSALAGAAASFISAFGDVTAVQRAMVWLAGSLADSRWVRVQTTVIWLAVPLALVLLTARELDLAGFGDDTGRGLGQRVELTRAAMLLACTVLTGAAVAAAGLIGFVGLVAPHLARRFSGPRHGRLLPLSALIGAALVLAADILGRVVIAPAELPVGIVTALIGAPFFGYLLWKRRNE